MTVNRRPITIVIAVACFSFISDAATLRGASAQDRMPGPLDIFQDFPDLRWEMSFQETRKAIEKSGARPFGLSNVKTELAWDGKFNGMMGRATVIFKEGGGIYEIAVVVHAFDKREDVFKTWLKKLAEKYGAAKQEEDNSIATSRLWRLKNGLAVELRVLKDQDSPVVDVHWVKE